MTDREAVEEMWRMLSPLRDGKRERQMKKLIKWHLGEEACARLDAEARQTK